MLERLLTTYCFLFTFAGLVFAQDLHVPDQFLVQLKADINQARFDEFLIENPNFHNYSESLFSDLKIYRIFSSDITEDAAMLQLKQSEIFENVQYNHLGISKRENVPNDGNLAAQWHLRQIDAFNAWDFGQGGISPQGDTIVIAVVDEGFDMNHLDLNFWKNKHEIPNNGIDDDANGYIDDYHGWNAYDDNGNMRTEAHGTMVAGVAGATGNNMEGLAGVNWKSKIMPVLGLSGDEATVVKAYNYVYTQRKRYNETNGDSGAYVVVCNSSFGKDRAKPIDYPNWCGLFDKMGEVGILSVGATANWNSDVDIEGDIPTTCPSDYLVSVTSTNKLDFLSTSPGAAYGLQSIDLGAPGVSIFSTTINSNYTSKNGTSYAAPMVSGAIALMHSVLCDDLTQLIELRPDSLALILKDYLLLDGVDKIESLEDKMVSGGRLNLLGAVSSVINCYILGGDALIENELAAIVYPNPSSGSIQFNRLSEGIGNYQIRDLRGSLISEFEAGSKESISLNIKKSGLYFLSERDDVNQKTLKIVVY